MASGTPRAVINDWTTDGLERWGLDHNLSELHAKEVKHDCPSKARDSGVVFAAWTRATTLPRRSPIRVGH